MKQVLHLLTTAEWLAAWFTQLAFWHISPPIRDRWVWLLLLPVGFSVVRWIITRKMPFHTLTALIATGFIVITLFNFEAAPLSRQDYWVLVCRPLAGLWLVLATVNLVKVRHSLALPLAAMTFLAAVGVVLGLTATQWTDKSTALEGIIAVLPTLNSRAVLPDAQLSFNPNELAGALALLCPLMLGLGLWSQQRTPRILFMGLALGLLVALLLGQSRFALGGVLAGSGLIALLAASPRARMVIVSAGVVLILVEAIIITTTNPNAAQGDVLSLSGRDTSSLELRLDMLERSARMLRDYPLTGVGMSMFRTAIRQPEYQIEALEQRNVTMPHAHNLWFQMAADLGVPGLIWYGVLHAGLVWGLVVLWRSGQRHHQRLAAALAGSLLAYSIYGMGDAITLWDRLGFVWWAVIAILVSTVYMRDLIYNESVVSPSEMN